MNYFSVVILSTFFALLKFSGFEVESNGIFSYSKFPYLYIGAKIKNLILRKIKGGINNSSLSIPQYLLRFLVKNIQNAINFTKKLRNPQT